MSFFRLEGRVAVSCSMSAWGAEGQRRRIAVQESDGKVDPWRVGRDEIEGRDLEVSTVFLGLDHSWGGGEPILFETMVLREAGGGLEDLYMERSSTWERAANTHERVVAGVRDGSLELYYRGGPPVRRVAEPHRRRRVEFGDG